MSNHFDGFLKGRLGNKFENFFLLRKKGGRGGATGVAFHRAWPLGAPELLWFERDESPKGFYCPTKGRAKQSLSQSLSHTRHMVHKTTTATLQAGWTMWSRENERTLKSSCFANSLTTNAVLNTKSGCCKVWSHNPKLLSQVYLTKSVIRIVLC